MGTSHHLHDNGVAEVVMNRPPVNALTVAGWFELAELLTRLGRDPQVRVIVLRAEGRGFNAGVDIKEMQATEGFSALLGANRGCYAAFKAVYECEVPVIAAVHGYCLGGGVGLVGNADVIVASEDATFGLPEVDRGALGAATHLARLVPQHAMRAMVYLASTATAQQLHLIAPTEHRPRHQIPGHRLTVLVSTQHARRLDGQGIARFHGLHVSSSSTRSGRWSDMRAQAGPRGTLMLWQRSPRV